MRYLCVIQFNGTNYKGWQIQPHDVTVQGMFEKSLNILLRGNITVVGCGRTDTGVHASHFVLHFDYNQSIDLDTLIYKLNELLPEDIYVESLHKVSMDFHARYGANSRRYTYKLSLNKDPFGTNLVYHYKYSRELDIGVLNQAASLILDQDEFLPFCKTGSDNKGYHCKIIQSHWQEINSSYFEYTVEANRFLRGMVRLLVGMTLSVARGKMKIEDVKNSLEKQVPLTLPWSVPAHGLYLSKIKYPSGILPRE